MSDSPNCPSCGHTMPADVDECPECGHALAGWGTDSVLDDPEPSPTDSFPNLAALMAGITEGDTFEPESPFDEVGAAEEVASAETAEIARIEEFVEPTGKVEDEDESEGEGDDDPAVEPTTIAEAVPDQPPIDMNAETLTFQATDGDTGVPAFDAEPSAVSTSEPTPSAVPSSQPARAATVPRSWFVLALTYGSVVTMLLVGLVLDVRNGGLVFRWLDPPPHQLESLPDIVRRSDLRIVPEDAELPAGHVLAIGDERRFGDVGVRVVGVTREPVVVRFQDVLGNPTTADESDVPVLKLWLEVENLSSSRPIAPFDRVLLFARGRTSQAGESRGNQFVCRLDEQRPGGELVRPFVVNDGELDGQELDRTLAPGARATYYIPCEEAGADELTGELVWRVQFRKGYGPTSGKGVTTLVDVRFHADDVETKTVGEPDA